MIEKLCMINGISGNEEPVCNYILNCIKDTGYKTEILPNGSLIVYKKGRKTPSEKLMVFAHTDEIGLIVSDVTEEGFLKFDTVGSVDERILLSKKVLIGENCVPGIIGVKAIHLIQKEERKKTVPLREMYIDIGANSKKEALEYIRPGDYVAFDTKSYFNENRLLAKAIDDRVGVSLLIELVKRESEYDFIACFDTLEEVGARGATVAAEYIKPHYALVLEGTTCSDINGTEEHLRSTCLGDGPALSVRDMGACYHSAFNEKIIALAEKNSIKYQIKKTHRGANDSSALQSAGYGVKTAVISLPVRYIHSPVGVMDNSDYENGLKLAGLITDSIGEF